MWTEITVIEKVELRSPVVLVQGLPGLGFVGKITADYLIDQLSPVKFAELYSSYMTMPDGNVGIQVNQDGTYLLPKFDFFAHTSSKPNIIFLTGDIQPTPLGQYEVANRILSFVQEYGCERVIALGGFQTLAQEELGRVYGVINNAKVGEELERSGVVLTKTGAITGACGIMLGLGQRRKLDCIGLLGATKGEYPDMSAAKCVIQILSHILNLDVNLGKLDSDIEEMKSKVENLRKAQMEAFRGAHKEEDKAPFYV